MGTGSGTVQTGSGQQNLTTKMKRGGADLEVGDYGQAIRLRSETGTEADGS